MIERGVVVEVIGNTAKIRMTQKPGCAKCGICSASSSGSRVLTIHTQTPVAVSKIVEVEINEKFLVLSSVLLYGVPAVSFIMGAVVGYVVGGEIIATAFALGLLILDFIIMKIITKKMCLPERIAKIVC